MSFSRWFLELLIAIDQLINVLITPLSVGAFADETLSGRAWRMDKSGRPLGKITRPVIDFIFFWQKQHCFQAYTYERTRLPPEHRN